MQRKYGLGYCPLSNTVCAGRVSKRDPKCFLSDREDVTQEFYRAVIQMWGGYEQEIHAPDGKVWRVEVKEIKQTT